MPLNRSKAGKITREKPVGSNPQRSITVVKKASVEIGKAASKFGVSAKEVGALMEAGDSDRAISHFQKKIYAAVVRLIPIAEKEYKISKRESQAYALNALISQARELATDIQMSNDRASVAERIVSENLMPTFRKFVELLVNESQTLKGVLKSKMKDGKEEALESAVDSLLATVARSGNVFFQESASDVRELLGADSRKRGPTAKQKTGKSK